MYASNLLRCLFFCLPLTHALGFESNFANNDPVYRKLRDIGLGLTIKIQDFSVQYDVATFHFDEGTITFLAPVNGSVTGAIFIGKGRFTFRPGQQFDQREFMRRAQTDQLSEEFSEVVFRFTGQVSSNFVKASKGEATTPANAAALLSKWEERVRERHENAHSLTEDLLNGDDMDNLDAEVLAAVYNPGAHGMFSAYIRGSKHKDLRFLARTRGGAVPQFDTPEEVALVNYDPEGLDDGIWFLSHLQNEWKSGNASSMEEQRFFASHKYKVETSIANNDHFTSITAVTYQALIPGERVMRFHLLPNLRVSRVADAGNKEMFFIQEDRKSDGSLYVILPEAADPAKESTLSIEYSGDKVVTKAGNGSFYVGAREAWFPNLNGFGDRAVYDLTYRVPKRYRVISVGTLDREAVEDNQAVSHWVTPKPVAIAGFNFGEYKKTEFQDEKIGYHIAGYYLPELPDLLAQFKDSALSGMAPSGMTKYVLDQTRAQLEVCTLFFGKSPFSEISITEQPNMNFGQSWPNLVYLPILAYIDSTQRWRLFGQIEHGMNEFVDEVTPHEVAHQWWGHTVGWATYHDQWLSEGFAEFSAGLFLQQAETDGQKKYIDFWDHLKKRILEKNQYGFAANDAGPLWLGLRLMSPRTMSAYQNVTYPKGAYVLAMIRSMMYSTKDHDQPFIDMMHDFVDTHREHPASTETFKMIVEKRMPPTMNLQGNGRLDWFFNEWVYGNSVPHYALDYQTSPAEGGKIKLHISITQSEVDKDFAMLVPIFADFGKGMIRLGQAGVAGNSTRELDVLLPAEPKKVAINVWKEVLER